MASRSVNKVILIGNLGGDPELRHTASNVPVVNFTVATNENWVNKEGVREERTEWHRVVAWRRLAEICHEYLRKGTQVYIEGKLQTRSWEDQSGQKRFMTEIVADEMVILGSRGADGAAGATGQHPAEDLDHRGSDLQEYHAPAEGDDDLPF
ncbi:MAG: hypothetical protein A2Z86_03035 [Candidatus Glassbacteria bacterium GWA2_58_10]|uniref:Single-stranded DNA-binding protein n=1 Tax=Candidatus Glassbacteria bacterium GWA2_58_10 TaxID=1817865 RepID=A0A1F5YIK8_9BACT|nr:MAG: hypothetical protein A2Z86_03035 [Candidatus Glassbacteria bacterium GWA2_58_10]